MENASTLLCSYSSTAFLNARTQNFLSREVLVLEPKNTRTRSKNQSSTRVLRFLQIFVHIVMSQSSATKTLRQN